MRIWVVILIIGFCFCSGEVSGINKYLSKSQQRRVEKMIAEKGYTVCVEWLEKIQEKYQGDYLFWMYKGICYSNMPGQEKNTEEALFHSIALGKDRVETYEVKYYLALYYFNRNRFEECNTICMEALSRVRQWKEGAKERYEALLTALERKQAEVLAAQKLNMKMIMERKLRETRERDSIERLYVAEEVAITQNTDEETIADVPPVSVTIETETEKVDESGETEPIDDKEAALLSALAKYKKTITYTPQVQMTTDEIHEALEAGQDIVICEVFDFNRIELNHNGNRFLELLSQVMQKNKSLKIEVTVHCDYIGSIRINRDFAMRRLKNIEKVLITRHIPLTNLTFTPCGSERPRKITELEAKEYPFLHEGEVLDWELLKGLTKQQRNQGHMLNRRVEIRKLQ